MLPCFNRLSISRRVGSDRALNVSPKDMDKIPPFALPDFMYFYREVGAAVWAAANPASAHLDIYTFRRLSKYLNV